MPINELETVCQLDFGKGRVVSGKTHAVEVVLSDEARFVSFQMTLDPGLKGMPDQLDPNTSARLTGLPQDRVGEVIVTNFGIGMGGMTLSGTGQLKDK